MAFNARAESVGTRLGRFGKYLQDDGLVRLDLRDRIEEHLSRDQFARVSVDSSRFNSFGELGYDKDIFGCLATSVSDGDFISYRLADRCRSNWIG